MSDWLTMTEYARQHGISREAVRKAVAAGRLVSNGRTGRDCRVHGEMVSSRTVTASAMKQEAHDRLEAARIEKIRADVDLQKQKLSTVQESIRREVAEMFLEEYTRAFAPLKVRLTELRLDADQTRDLCRIIDSCTDSLAVSLRSRIAGGTGDED